MPYFQYPRAIVKQEEVERRAHRADQAALEDGGTLEVQERATEAMVDVEVPVEMAARVATAARAELVEMEVMAHRGR